MCQMKSLQVFDILFQEAFPHALITLHFGRRVLQALLTQNYFTLKELLSCMVNPNAPDLCFKIKTSLRIKHEVYTFKGILLSLMTVIDMSSN
jgi:hypothetical protein